MHSEYYDMKMKKCHQFCIRQSHFSKINYKIPINIKFNNKKARCNANQKKQYKELNRNIAEFYDKTSETWEDVWGDHMHHGIYRSESQPSSNQEAQRELIDEALKWAGITRINNMVDVGCGVGGSSRYIVNKYNCRAKGITLSQKQVNRANEITREKGLEDKIEFIKGDALNQPFESSKFDLVWSMESGEHMPDKKKFVSELFRICAPEGRILIVTWCHRTLGKNEKLNDNELKLLKQIQNMYYLGEWVSIDTYKKLFEDVGLKEIKIDDWTDLVAPFWTEVFKSALTLRGIKAIIKGGPVILKSMFPISLMKRGYENGTIKFNIIKGEKIS